MKYELYILMVILGGVYSPDSRAEPLLKVYSLYKLLGLTVSLPGYFRWSGKRGGPPSGKESISQSPYLTVILLFGDFSLTYGPEPYLKCTLPQEHVFYMLLGQCSFQILSWSIFNLEYSSALLHY